jgi:hypothetical protein
VGKWVGRSKWVCTWVEWAGKWVSTTEIRPQCYLNFVTLYISRLYALA